MNTVEKESLDATGLPQRRGHALSRRALPPLPLQEVHRRPAGLRAGEGDRLLRRRPGQLRVPALRPGHLLLPRLRERQAREDRALPGLEPQGRRRRRTGLRLGPPRPDRPARHHDAHRVPPRQDVPERHAEALPPGGDPDGLQRREPGKRPPGPGRPVRHPEQPQGPPRHARRPPGPRDHGPQAGRGAEAPPGRRRKTQRSSRSPSAIRGPMWPPP